MKNMVECLREFFAYFNALETRGAKDIRIKPLSCAPLGFTNSQFGIPNFHKVCIFSKKSINKQTNETHSHWSRKIMKICNLEFVKPCREQLNIKVEKILKGNLD